MQRDRRNGKYVWRFLLGGAIAAAVAVVFVGCTIEKTGTGGWIVRPAPGDDPSMGGVYTEVEINGRCYYSNGEWCHPCGRGGQLVRCSEIMSFGNAVEALIASYAKGNIDALSFVAAMAEVDQPIEEGDQLVLDLQRELFELTGGLTGPEFLATSGWPTTLDVGTAITSPLVIHLFTDEGGLDFVDVSFLWRTDWAQPAPSAGADVHMYIAGDVYDNAADLQVIRISGSQASITETLEPLRVAGTPVTLTMLDGQSYTF